MIFKKESKEKEIIKMCRFCFMCRHACPVFLSTKRDTDTPRGHALLISRIDEGLSEWTDDIVDIMYRCSQCHLCREICEFHWGEDLLIQKIREIIVKIDRVPQSIKKLASHIINNGSVYDTSHVKNFKIAVKGKGIDVLYFAGDIILNEYPEIVEKTAVILDSMDINWAMLERETSTGIELFELGYINEAITAAKECAARIMETKPGIIITGNPHIYSAFKKLYPEWGIKTLDGINIYHISEYLSNRVREGKLKISLDSALQGVSYHDPCQLGREMEVYNAPRELIKAATGSMPLELFHSKSEAECCGAGSVMYLTHPDVSNRVAQKRINSALEEDVKIIVTACPNCKKVFKNTISDMNSDLKVIDIVELVSLQVSK